MLSDYISKRAKENNVEILEFITKEPQFYKELSEGKFFYRPLQIGAKAKFHDLALFLNSQERGSYFLETREVRIKKIGSPYHDFVLLIYALQQE